MYMKKAILIILTVLLLVTPMTANASAKPTNRQIVNALCTKYNKPVRIVDHNSKQADYIVLHRKNRPYIVVEKLVTTSNGKKGGYDKHGCYTAYNKKVKKGKKVTTYIIYNPKSNECDDILWVVDNQMYR